MQWHWLTLQAATQMDKTIRNIDVDTLDSFTDSPSVIVSKFN